MTTQTNSNCSKSLSNVTAERLKAVGVMLPLAQRKHYKPNRYRLLTRASKLILLLALGTCGAKATATEGDPKIPEDQELEAYNVLSKLYPGVPNYADRRSGGNESLLLSDLMNALLKEASWLNWSIFDHAIYRTWDSVQNRQGNDYIYRRHYLDVNEVLRFEVAPKTLIIQELHRAYMLRSKLSIDIAIRKSERREEVKVDPTCHLCGGRGWDNGMCKRILEGISNPHQCGDTITELKEACDASDDCQWVGAGDECYACEGTGREEPSPHEVRMAHLEESAGEVHHYVNEKASQEGDIPYTIRSIILSDKSYGGHAWILCRDTSVPLDDDAAWYELQNYPDRNVRPMSTNQMLDFCKEGKLGRRVSQIVYERLDL